MNLKEFYEWFRYHVSAYPKVKDHVANKDGEMIWAKAIMQVDLQHAKKATEMMLAGNIDVPLGYSNHPRTIVVEAKKLARQETAESHPRKQMIDGEETYDCWQCRDSGAVIIWGVDAMEAMRDGKFHDQGELPKKQRIYIFIGFAAACNCLRGDPAVGRKFLIRFNPRYMVPFGRGHDEDVKRLEKFFADKVQVETVPREAGRGQEWVF